MEGLFIEYKDPLFGIILFFALIFMITFFSYWWGRFKTKEDERSFSKFIKNFSSLPNESELAEMLNTSTLAPKSLYLLANSYIHNGDYDKAIEIYTALLSKRLSADEKKETMLLLGQTYLKAGFLMRSRDLFLEILSRYPRTPSALQFLLIIYEKMREFEKAKEVLEPLEELDMKVAKDSMYLNLISMQYDTSLPSTEKMEKIVQWYQKHHQLGYMIFEYLFRVDPSFAWKHLDQSLCTRISDILWSLDAHQLDLDIIASNAYLRELYSAKGLIKSAQSSSIFELDVLINLQEKAYTEADLQFEYLCNECKQVFPFSFHRCPNCLGIDTVENEMLLTKAMFETNLSFQ